MEILNHSHKQVPTNASLWREFSPLHTMMPALYQDSPRIPRAQESLWMLTPGVIISIHLDIAEENKNFAF